MRAHYDFSKTKRLKFPGTWIGPLSALTAVAGFHMWLEFFDWENLVIAILFLLLFAFVCSCSFSFPMRRGLLFVLPLFIWSSTAVIWWPAEDLLGWQGGENILRECRWSDFAYIPICISADVTHWTIPFTCLGLPIFNRLYRKFPLIVPIVELGFILFVQWALLHVLYWKTYWHIPEAPPEQITFSHRFLFGPYFWLVVFAIILGDFIVFRKLIPLRRLNPRRLLPTRAGQR